MTTDKNEQRKQELRSRITSKAVRVDEVTYDGIHAFIEVTALNPTAKLMNILEEVVEQIRPTNCGRINYEVDYHERKLSLYFKA